MGPPSYMGSVVDRNFVMRRITVLFRLEIGSGKRNITTYLPTYLPTHPPTHLPTYLPTYLPNYLTT